MKKVYRKGEAWGACLGVGEGCFQLCALSTDPKLSRGGHRFDSKLINFEFFFPSMLAVTGHYQISYSLADEISSLSQFRIERNFTVL